MLLMIAAMALWTASLGLFISAISKNENQVVLIALSCLLVLGLMGGAIFPLDMTSSTFCTIGHTLPTAWAIDGFQDIALRGLSGAAVLLPAGVLFAYAALFFVLAVRRFKFE